MTLVGIIVKNNSLIIISDVLLSTKYNYFEPKPIPSIGQFKGVDNTIISNIVQKIYMFSSKSLIGFAGNLYYAQECINEIKRLDNFKNLTKINEIMTKYKNKGQFSCIFVNKEKNKTNLISTSEIYENFSNLDYVSVIGSGSITFLEYLKKIDENFDEYIPYIRNNDSSSQNNQVELEIFMALQIISEFFKEDFVQQGKSLQNKFGGFYEVILEFQNHFRKLSNYNLCIWYYRKKKLELKYKFHPIYKEKGLFIHKLEFKGKNYIENEFYLKKLEKYYQNLKKNEKSSNIDYNLDCDCLLNIIYTINGQNVVSSVEFLITSNKFEKCINLKLKDGKVLEFTYSKEFRYHLLDSLSLKKGANQKTILDFE